MQNNVILHADDFGLTAGITRDLLEEIDKGSLRSVSVVPNGYDFEHAVKELKERSGIRISIHLNLCEGYPVLPSTQVGRLVDGRGLFNESFLSLWSRFLFAGREEKVELGYQIKLEFKAQIERVCEALSIARGDILIDGHQYFHLIPPIFKIVQELHTEYRFSCIRIPYEPFFICTNGEGFLRSYLGPNLVKHLLLKFLSILQKPSLQKAGILSNKCLIGILFSGRMSTSSVRSALSCVSPNDDDRVVEIVFHPGRATVDEGRYWEGRPSLRAFYTSPARNHERAVLRELFQSHGGEYA